MTKILCILGVCLGGFVPAFGEDFLWPLMGRPPGEGILYTPADLVYLRQRDTEVPLGRYFLTAPEGTEIQAAMDGRVLFASYHYAPDFFYSYSDDSYTNLKSLVEEQNSEEVRYISYCLGIEIAPREILWYSGLSAPAHRIFQTGETVSRGDLLGTMGRACSKIDGPSLEFSLDINGKAVDPGPLLLGIDNGLEWGREERINYRTHLFSDTECRNAVETAYRALSEGHPGFTDYTSMEEWSALKQSVLEDINEPMTADGLYRRIFVLVSAIHDNHVWLRRLYRGNDDYLYSPECALPFHLMQVGQGLFIRTDQAGKLDPGTEIEAINGISSEDLFFKLWKTAGTGDGNIESWKRRNLLLYYNDYLLVEMNPFPGDSIQLRTTGGEEVEYTVLRRLPEESAGRGKMLEWEELEENLYCLTLHSFSLLDTESEELREYLDLLTSSDTLVIDLRNNFGGEAENIIRLVSYFIEESIETVSWYKVASNGNYEFFEDTENYYSDMALYEDYHPLDGEEGFYLLPEDNPEEFSSITPAEGGVELNGFYVLTNGYTGSAAVEAAALLRLHANAVIAGVEGCNSPVTMNAIDFAQVYLGNTGLLLRIPLIQFRTEDPDGILGDPGDPLLPDLYLAPTVASELSSEDELLLLVQEEIREARKRSQRRINRRLLSGKGDAPLVCLYQFSCNQFRQKNSVLRVVFDDGNKGFSGNFD